MPSLRRWLHFRYGPPEPRTWLKAALRLHVRPMCPLVRPQREARSDGTGDAALPGVIKEGTSRPLFQQCDGQVKVRIVLVNRA